MRKSLAVVFIVVAMALAGCSDKKSSPDDEFVGPDLNLSDETGVIRGIVIDSAVRPIEGVIVALVGMDLETTTDANGAFGFGDLDPGTYFVKATKIGFTATQQSVDVEAGVAMPDIVKILVESDPASLPSFSVIHFSGFLECTATAVIYFVPACDGVGNDKYEDQWEMPGKADHIHVSMLWEPTQPVGTSLYFNLYEPTAYDIVAWNGGPSPLVADANATVLESINNAGIVALEVATDGEAGTGVGAAYQQSFDAYIVFFHNFTPPEDYQFWRDGEPIVPS